MPGIGAHTGLCARVLAGPGTGTGAGPLGAGEAASGSGAGALLGVTAVSDLQIEALVSAKLTESLFRLHC